MSVNASPRMGLSEWGMLLLLALIWGGSFLFSRIAVLEVPPLTLVFYRVAIAAFVLNMFLVFSRNKGGNPDRLWTRFAVMGLLNNIIPFSLIFYGQQEIGAGLAAIVNAMTPIWTILIAHVFTADERLNANRIVGVALGFAGVALLIGLDSVDGLSGTAWGQIAVLGATISYGCASVYGRTFQDVAPMQTARGQLTASAILMLPVAAIADQFWTLPIPSAAAIWSVLLLAIVCTAIAYILFFTILARAGATNISLVTLLVPVSAVILGALILDETFAGRHLAGMTLIMLGLMVVDGRAIHWVLRRTK